MIPPRRRLLAWLPLPVALLLACTPATVPERPAPTAGAVVVPADTTASAPLELDTLNIAAPSATASLIPLQVAIDAGYFQDHGLNLNLTWMTSTMAVQGLASRSVDLYFGGTSIMSGTLSGADIIYIGAAADRIYNALFGEKGMTSFLDLRGKTVATQAPGATGHIAFLQSAKLYGLVPDQDIAVRHTPNAEAVFAAFTTGQTQGGVVIPPWNVRLLELDYPLLVDYYELGLKIIGPAPAVSRAFARAHPNTVKAFMRGYLDGVKRAFDDPGYTIALYAANNRIDDQQQAVLAYEEGRRIWNKNLAVERASIEVVLQHSEHPNARTANPDDFYDNTYIGEVNANYAPRLFPEVFGAH